MIGNTNSIEKPKTVKKIGVGNSDTYTVTADDNGAIIVLNSANNGSGTTIEVNFSEDEIAALPDDFHIMIQSYGWVTNYIYAPQGRMSVCTGASATSTNKYPMYVQKVYHLAKNWNWHYMVLY